ncbi:unnamed protein product [Angiostrongylus costaricensis]|uniref:SANT domain-containing protein n=1 Tax=Angiostrongylus costaricensis TaxID=334426 RepID=A0A158PLS9_ANGCS|nr:unnamed protein product [Angiostrongylus costaricensis]
MAHASLGRCTSKDGVHAFVKNEVGEPNLLEEMEVDALSDAHSDTHSDTSPFRSTLILKEGNSSHAQNAGYEKKSRQNEDISSKKATKRCKRTRTKRNDSDDDNEDEEKDEDVEVDHKECEDYCVHLHYCNSSAMLSSADRKIQVGDDFQARVDEPQKEQDDTLMDGEREHVLWCPPADIDEISLNEYCEYAAEKYKLAQDQALYLLQKSNFDFHVAQEKVRRRRPINEEWGEDDRALFKQTLLMFGKRFDKIRQMFYYNTKKDTDYKSLIDTRMAEDSEEDDCADDPHNETNVCGNCGEECREVHVLDNMQLCFVCWTYFRFLGKHRPCNFLSTVKEIRQRRRKCPSDMLDIAHSFVEMSSYVDHEFVPDNENVIDGMVIVEMPKTKCHEEIKAVMCELAKVRARAIRLEQSIKSQRSEGVTDGLESYRYLTISDKKDEEGFSMKLDEIKRCESWSEEERMVAFRCLLRYEEDFDAVSEVVGTKTPDQIKNFYMEVRSDVDKVLKKLAPFVPEMSDICAP